MRLPPRYGAAVVIDALGTGLLRPFMLLYGLRVLGLGLGETGLALTSGLVVGLALIPLAGWWIDRGPGGVRRAAASVLLIRVLGVAVLVGSGPLWTFVAAAVLLSVGTQCWPPMHAAIVSGLVPGSRERDVALSAARAARNAGLGLGALIATATVAGGAGALRWLAVVSGFGYLAAALLVLTLHPAQARHTPPETAGPVRVPPWFTVVLLANLPFALLFDVLEAALPAVFLEQLHANQVWPGIVFLLNTLLVIVVSVPLTLRLARYSRPGALGLAGAVLAASYLGFLGFGELGGWAGIMGVVLVSVGYTLGEVLYTSSGTSLVIATAPPGRLGWALARWELSTGLGKAVAPAVLLGLFGLAPWALWVPLALATAAGGLVIAWPALTSRQPPAASTLD